MAKKAGQSAVEFFRDLIGEVSHTWESAATDLRVQFSIAVEARLRERGWTQVRLAEEARMPESSISEIMHADGNPTVDTIARVLFALGLRGNLKAVDAAVIAETEETTNGKEVQWIELCREEAAQAAFTEVTDTAVCGPKRGSPNLGGLNASVFQKGRRRRNLGLRRLVP